MLVFITSLRHPQNSNSYESIGKLLEKTLASVCAQTDRDFRVIVVCNLAPPIRYATDRVEFAHVDFDPPSQLQGPQTGIQAVRTDKGSKLLVGLLAARKYRPDHVMFFDSDDRVSNRLAAHANAQKSAPGWYVDEGYSWTNGGCIVKKHRNFHLLCGTSHIVHFSSFDLDGEADVREHQDQATLMRRFGPRFVRNIIGCHMTMADYFRSLDAPLQPLPFPGAVWVLATGENHSGSGSVSFGGMLSPSMGREFGIEVDGHSRSRWLAQNVRGLSDKLLALAR